MDSEQDFCWYCPICDLSLSMKDIPNEELQALKQKVSSGNSVMVHEAAPGKTHVLEMVKARH